MLPLPRFSIDTPDRIDDAVALAAQPDVRVLAGGTDLLPNIKHRLFSPRALVSLRRLGLSGIHQDGAQLVIGATTSLWAVRKDPRVVAGYPGLAAACATVATRTIQGAATLGGNLLLNTRCAWYNQPQGWREGLGGCLKSEGDTCHVARTGAGCYAVQSSDTVPVLWLLGAQVVLVGPQGVRTVPVSELYDPADGRRWLRLRAGELLTQVRLPAPGAPVVHHKVRLRKALDYAALLVAVQRQGAGARAVLGAIGPAPILVQVDHADDLPDAAHAVARPLNTHVVSTSWRRHMVRVAVSRALEEATL